MRRCTAVRLSVGLPLADVLAAVPPADGLAAVPLANRLAAVPPADGLAVVLLAV